MNMTTRVLVADDDAELRGAVAHSLALEGMSVDEAASGAEALTKLAEGGVDLLVTDVVMPDLNGVQAAAMARTAGVELPILVMTGRREPWIAESVHRLQCADLLYKPFSLDELIEHAKGLLARRASSPVLPIERSEPHVFPPALVPLLRRSIGDNDILGSADDEMLTELLSVTFFAGLATEEGDRHPVHVVFVGHGATDEPPTDGVPPALFRWSTIRFKRARPLTVNELVKLAAASPGGREYVQVAVEDEALVVTGLAREGVNLEGDQALKIVVERAGGLSVRMGRHHVLDYEHGRVQSLVSNKFVLSGGPVRRVLERTSTRAGLPPAAAARYLDAVRMLVTKLSAHGSGGILVFGAESTADPDGNAGYPTQSDISIAAMLGRLHRLQSPIGHEQTELLAGALQSEIQHTIAELGALTALDGATILDAALAPVGFGIVLPVVEPRAVVVEADDLEGAKTRPFDLGTRGTRHRAAAVYAWTHPGSVVFVASQDGALGCLYRAADAPFVTLWQFRRSDLRS